MCTSFHSYGRHFSICSFDAGRKEVTGSGDRIPAKPKPSAQIKKPDKFRKSLNVITGQIQKDGSPRQLSPIDVQLELANFVAIYVIKYDANPSQQNLLGISETSSAFTMQILSYLIFKETMGIPTALFHWLSSFCSSLSFLEPKLFTAPAKKKTGSEQS